MLTFRRHLMRTVLVVIFAVLPLGTVSGSSAQEELVYKIVFSSQEFVHGDRDIYVMDAIDGATPIRLTNNDVGADHDPSWSPDGSQIAFECGLGSGGEGGGSPRVEICVINSDGTNQINLTNTEETDGWPSWSPDGSQIMFFSQLATGTEIYVINLDGTNLMRLTDTAGYWNYPYPPASWSPDGSKIVFDSNRDNGVPNIYVMNSDGTNQTRLTNSPGDDVLPKWSPDGSKILYRSTPEIYVMDADGMNQTRLTNSLGYNSSPSWSPDGSQIAFYSDRDGNSKIYVMNADGTNQESLTDSAGEDIHPSWSPDGRQIAFLSWRDNTYCEIYLIDADGTNLTRLTNSPGGSSEIADIGPSWNPVPEPSRHLAMATALLSLAALRRRLH